MACPAAFGCPCLTVQAAFACLAVPGTAAFPGISVIFPRAFFLFRMPYGCLHSQFFIADILFDVPAFPLTIIHITHGHGIGMGVIPQSVPVGPEESRVFYLMKITIYTDHGQYLFGIGIAADRNTVAIAECDIDSIPL